MLQLNPEFMWFYFMHKDMPYSLRGRTLGLPKFHSFYYSTNAVHFFVSLIWNNFLAVVKSSNSLFEFKNKIKTIGNTDWGFNMKEYICFILFRDSVGIY